MTNELIDKGLTKTTLGSNSVDSMKLSGKLEYYTANWKEIEPESVIPTIDGFMYWSNVGPTTVEKKLKTSRRFARIYRRMYALQVSIIANKAVNKDFDSGFSKFFMSAVHGWREKSDITSDSKGISLTITGGSDV
jgi:hypothetical protein